jgi:hypothetical protein
VVVAAPGRISAWAAVGGVVALLVSCMSAVVIGRRIARGIAATDEALREREAALATSTERLTILHGFDAAIIAADDPAAAEAVLRPLFVITSGTRGGSSRASRTLISSTACRTSWSSRSGSRSGCR